MVKALLTEMAFGLKVVPKAPVAPEECTIMEAALPVKLLPPPEYLVLEEMDCRIRHVAATEPVAVAAGMAVGGCKSTAPEEVPVMLQAAALAMSPTAKAFDSETEP